LLTFRTHYERAISWNDFAVSRRVDRDVLGILGLDGVLLHALLDGLLLDGNIVVVRGKLALVHVLLHELDDWLLGVLDGPLAALDDLGLVERLDVAIELVDKLGIGLAKENFGCDIAPATRRMGHWYIVYYVLYFMEEVHSISLTKRPSEPHSW